MACICVIKSNNPSFSRFKPQKIMDGGTSAILESADAERKDGVRGFKQQAENMANESSKNIKKVIVEHFIK